jgi:hypothetical protein
MIKFRALRSKTIAAMAAEFFPYPNCKNCIHLRPRLFEEYNRCGKFKTYHFITGEPDYEYTYYARSDPKKCGEEGKYFVFDGGNDSSL